MKRNNKYMTQEEAKNIIDLYAENTAYFDGEISINEMYEMFKNRMGFGEVETNVILGALVMAGAKFSGSLVDRYKEFIEKKVYNNYYGYGIIVDVKDNGYIYIKFGCGGYYRIYNSNAFNEGWLTIVHE